MGTVLVFLEMSRNLARYLPIGQFHVGRVPHVSFSFPSFPPSWTCAGLVLTGGLRSYVFFVAYYDPTDPDAVEAVDREIFTPGSSGKVINEVGERDTDAMLSGYDDYSLETSVEETSKGKRRQFLYFVLFHLGVIVVISVGVIMMLVTGPSSTEVVTYADALGIISSLIVFAQFTPQIYVTWKLKVDDLRLDSSPPFILLISLSV